MFTHWVHRALKDTCSLSHKLSFIFVDCCLCREVGPISAYSIQYGWFSVSIFNNQNIYAVIRNIYSGTIFMCSNHEFIYILMNIFSENRNFSYYMVRWSKYMVSKKGHLLGYIWSLFYYFLQYTNDIVFYLVPQTVKYLKRVILSVSKKD